MIEETLLTPVTDSGSEEELRLLCGYFEEAENVTRDARELAERDRDYVDNDQWTSAELAILRKRKQPALTFNYVKDKVKSMCGAERRMRSDPKAFPRTPKEEQAAEAATDSLRFVADQNDFDETRSAVFENMVVEGVGGADVVVEEINGEYEIRVTQVPWDRLFYDPHSTRKDFSDAKYKGIVIWMDKADALSKYPDAQNSIETTFSVGYSDTFEDKPNKGMWCDSKRERLRLVQIHYQRGDEWKVATFSKGGFFVAPVVSPYVDKYGKPASSLHIRSGYIDRQNNRYGEVRAWISLQDEINKRRSKALHINNSRQSYGNATSVADVAETKRELNDPNGHVQLNGGAEFGKDFGIIPTGELAIGQMNLLQLAISEMQATGPNASQVGSEKRDLSGRALQTQQQAGQVTMETSNDGLRQWTKSVYEAVWLAVRQYWTAQKWIRVTDDERNIKWVGLNNPVTLEDKLKTLPPEEASQFAQSLQLQPGDPRLQEVVEVENEVAGIDVDITIEEGPDLTTLQSEQFEVLAGLAKAGLAIPPQAIIQASSLRNKDQILDEMEKGKQLPPEVQKQMQEMQQQLQQASEENKKLQQELANKQGELQIKAAALQIQQQKVAVDAQKNQPEMADPNVAFADLELTHAQTTKTEAEAQQTMIENDRLQRTPIEDPNVQQVTKGEI